MHEQSVVESILALALEHAEKAKASRILRIDLVVGELSGVVEDAVVVYFSFLARNTIASQAALCFTHVPTTLRCRNCDRVFVPSKTDWRCPECRDQQVEIAGGRELYIDSIEVE